MMKRMYISAQIALLCGILLLAPVIAGAQAKAKMINGIVYRIHSGFLEVQSGPKEIAMVKVNAATVYWNGKTDKKASATDLQMGTEVVIEATEKDGWATAQKVRFMPVDK
jgi:hypothetical protein